ncbi:MAG TPA: sulfotransferase domain-containing protein [Pyrinomonadaceae bacterium]|jgi:hypothetical protein
MRVVIYGLAKSGTTALFYLIRDSLAPGAVCLFEPRAFDPRAVKKGLLARLIRGRREPDVLAKVLPFRPTEPADAASFDGFDKQILLVRDPRDRAVSRLLYGVYNSTFCKRDAPLADFLDLLKRKEADPRSVSVRELLQTFARLNGDEFSFDGWAAEQARHSVRAPLDFHDCHAGLFVCKYEEMVEGRLAALEDYLGLKLSEEVSVPAEHRRVTRSKTHGGWRDWLTPEDVEYLRPVLRPYLGRYYAGADWDLSERPAIPADFGSGYVLRIVNERRAAEGLPPFGG